MRLPLEVSEIAVPNFEAEVPLKQHLNIPSVTPL
jgi:hypothetical protein